MMMNPNYPPLVQPVIPPVAQPIIPPAMSPTIPPYVQPAVPQPQPAQPWKIKFPAIITGILSFFQLVIAIAIIGCEIGSILIDMITSTIYVGLWAGFFFLIASISLAVSCKSFFIIFFSYIDLLPLSLCFLSMLSS